MAIIEDPSRGGLLEDIQRHPTTSAIAAVAIGAFIEQERAPEGMLRLFSAPPLYYHAYPEEAWRLITATLLHGGILHIFFNVALFWGFGKAIERWVGSWKALGLFLAFAPLTIAAEFIALNNAIGLSGVIYGYFGILMVGRKYDFDMAGVCNKRTVEFLLFWFLLCIVLSMAEILPIGNLAHGAGLGLGFLLGKAAFEKHRERWVAALAAAVSAIVALAAFAPQIHDLIFGPQLR